LAIAAGSNESMEIGSKTYSGAVLKVIALGFLVVSAPVAAAQSQSLPTENVVISASKLAPEAALRAFVKSYAAPAPVNGKMTRWKDGICPVTSGFPQAANKLVTERVRQIAGMVGAPVAPANSCKFNIDIVFTLHPQVLLDEVRKKNPVLLGYHDVAQEDRLATVTHPVQAWYTTQTVDLNGTTYVDDRLRNHGGFSTIGSFGPKYGNVFVPDARVEHASASRVIDSLSSELFHVVIVIDLAKVDGRTIGELADYVAMLSLAQTHAFEVCEPVASITNLVSLGCDADVKASGITANDLAYLHGLYSINPRSSFLTQQENMAYQMTKGIKER
jgi:hypothetical protein